MDRPLQTTRRVLNYESPLSTLQINQLWRLIGREHTSEKSVSNPDETMVFLVARVLHNTRLLTADQFWCVMSESLDAVRNAGRVISEQIGTGKGIIFSIAFSDRRFVTWTGTRNWLDMETGEWRELISAPVESIAYNLNRIAEEGLDMIQRAQRAMEITDDSKQTSDK